MRQLNENYSNSNNIAVLSTSTHETSKTFSYNGNEVLFNIKDDVMVNATQLAKIYGKRPNDYLSLPATNQLINAITRKYGIAENQLVRTERGGIAPGTWMHRLIVVDFCQWLDIDLKLWCTEKLDELMRYGMTATQPTLEQMINNPDLVISLATQLKNEREEKARLEQEKKRLEDKTARQEPLVSFAESAFKAEGKVDIGQAAKILNLGFGRNTLFKKLKEVGVFFKDRNEPKQKYIDAGYFEMTLLPPIHRDSHPDILYQKVLCKPKGLAYINYLFGGKPSDGKTAKIK
jgi:phage antirepressor YoqD-like protein